MSEADKVEAIVQQTTGLSAFQRASVLVQQAARAALDLPLPKRRVLVAVFAELTECVPPMLLSTTGTHGAMKVRFAHDGTPIRDEETK